MATQHFFFFFELKGCVIVQEIVPPRQTVELQITDYRQYTQSNASAQRFVLTVEGVS